MRMGSLRIGMGLQGLRSAWARHCTGFIACSYMHLRLRDMAKQGLPV